MVVENTHAVNLVTSEYYNPRITMDQNQYDRERITSAADAMLKLSTSFQPEIADSKPVSVIEYSNSPTSVHDHSSDMEDGMRPRSSSLSSKDRAERAFVPENKKDEQYWSKRRKNNEAAKRSREKRKLLDMATCEKVSYLVKINNDLKDELKAMKEYFALPVDQPFCASNVKYNFPGKKSTEELIYNSFRTIKPAAPAIPLATMASFLQQQQQLVTQAAMEAAYQNSVVNSTDIKPVVVVPENSENPSMYTPISPVSTSSTILAPSNLMQPQYKPIDAVANTKQLILNNGYNNEKYEKLEDEIRNDVIAMKRRKISTTSVKSEDEDDDCKLEIDERSNSPQMMKDCGPNTAHSSTTSAAFSNAYENYPLPNGNNHASTENNASFQSVNFQQKGIPFKLRHKHMNIDQLNSSSADNSSDNSGPKIYYGNESVQNTYISGRLDNVPAVINDIDSSSEDSSSYLGESDNSYQNQNSSSGGYNERRRKNNLAARKCRENKKLLLKMKEAQSEYLESENRKLKDDLTILSNEVQSLKDLMSQKQTAEKQGEMFVPPPLDVLQKIIIAKSLSASKQ